MLQRARERYSDVTDLFERHVWKKRTYVQGGGSIIHVKGTGTEDEEVVVIQGTSGFQLADESDAEVHVLSGSSDTNHKMAILSIPHTQQREWKEGAGGVQSPTDKTRAVEVNSKRSYVDDPNKERCA
jgi:hypothetical protein